mmetsp:Transcript_24549/g.49233  ORF Transcript_24549/g.49233 Transcript_24549/m.49233 type:complete len:80 (+) Transcript_24549:18-257(+)
MKHCRLLDKSLLVASSSRNSSFSVARNYFNSVSVSFVFYRVSSFWPRASLGALFCDGEYSAAQNMAIKMVVSTEGVVIA